MPNWCINRLSVYGPKADLKKFADRATDPDNTLKRYENRKLKILSTYVPLPEGLEGTNATQATAEPHPNWAVMLASGEMSQEWYDDIVKRNAKDYAVQEETKAKYGFADWYDWCIANWGTKWGDCDTFITYMGDDELSIQFESAWSPPVMGLVKVSEQFPTLKFVLSFSESGMGFVGAASMSAGCLLYSESGSLPELDVSLSDEEQAWANYHESTQDLMLKFHLAASAALGAVSV